MATKETISADEFFKADLRAGKITAAEVVPKSKMLKLTVSFGPEIGSRTILASIAEAYTPENAVGLSVLAIINLPSRTMKGIESNGMLFAGKSALTGQVMLISTAGLAEGEEVG